MFFLTWSNAVIGLKKVIKKARLLIADKMQCQDNQAGEEK
jgi:hypothetical protein